MDKKQAMEDIVHYNTLPPQIDYRLPYRLKADAAEEYLKTLPDYDAIMGEVGEQIDEYWNSEVSYLDSLF